MSYQTFYIQIYEKWKINFTDNPLLRDCNNSIVQ